jgi:nucleoside-diphosphate-sugar epimerase
MAGASRRPFLFYGPAMSTNGMTVAVTGPTGTFGMSLMPLLQADGRISRVVGIARRPFDPVEHGWTKMRYIRGDVREPEALERAFSGADVVVHLAFMITGAARGRTIRAINVDGILNAFRAAASAGVTRFVYPSSVAAYGFHRDNPVGMTEEWPARPDPHLFYAREKAEIEALLREEQAAHPEVDLYILRPPVVLGPHTVGAKNVLPDRLEPIGRRLGGLVASLPVALPVPAPRLPLQFIHEEDVARALLLCIVGGGPAGTYNITGDDVLTVDEVARELGLAPLPVPSAVVQTAARAVARIPFAPHVAGWAEAASHPAIIDASKAKRELGWRPRHTSLGALREALRSET